MAMRKLYNIRNRTKNKNVINKIYCFLLLVPLLLLKNAVFSQSCDFSNKQTITVGAIPTCSVITQLSTANQALIARDKVTLQAGFSLNNTTLNMFSVYTQNSIVPTASYTPLTNVVDGASRTLNTTDCIPGSINGAMNVGSNGKISYTIPINISPGTKGMQPSIAIEYSSGSGNGLLGLNWQLGGISSISRNAKTSYYDNENTPIQYTTSDAFSLNGQRLISTGVNTYSPENNPYVKVAFNSNGFKITYPSGIVEQYGQTATSQITPVGASLPVQYCLNRITDSDSNYVDYSYLADASRGENRIDEIKYTGNSTSNKSPFNSIKFVYSRRTDQNTYYISGYPMQQTLRLDAIRVFNEERMAKEYTFTYFADTYTKLNQISLNDNGITYNPIIINWANTDISNVSYIDVGSSSSSGVQLDSLKTNKVYFGDLNNDGNVDVIKWYNNSKTLNCAISNGSSVNIPLTSVPLDIKIVDWNNDGKDDIAVHIFNNSNDTVNYYSVSNGITTLIDQKATATGVGNYSYLYSDLNGDGIVERIMTSFGTFVGIEKIGNVSVISSSNINFTSVYGIKLLDFNGDGTSEIIVNACVLNSTSMLKSYSTNILPTQTCGDYILKLTGTTLIGTFLNNATINSFSNVYYGDFNGDGISDKLNYNSTWSLMYGTGTGYIAGTAPTDLSNIIPTNSNSKIKIIDLNGDGKDDIICALDGTIRITLSSGLNSFAPTSINTISSVTGISNVFLDVIDLPLTTNPTEPLQIVYGNDASSTHESYKLMVFNTRLNGSLLVKDITDGLNNRTAITYTNPTTATTTSPLPTPLKLVKIKMMLPTRIVRTNGNTVITDYSYTYANAYEHPIAGILGFTSFTEAESVTGLSSTSTYKMAISNGTNTCYNPWKDSYTVKACGNIMSSSTFVTQPKGGDMSKKIFYPFTSQTASTNSLTGVSTTSNMSFDETLGVPTSTTSTVDGWTVTNNCTYTQVPNNRIRLNQTESIKTKGTQSYSSTVNYNYDGSNPMRLVSTSNLEGTVALSGFDSYGNATSSTFTPAGSSTSRSNSWTYDPTGRFVTSTTDPRGYTTRNQYRSSDGARTATIDYNNLVTSYSNNNDGGKFVSEVTLPDGATSSEIVGWDNTGTGLYYSKQSESNGNVVTRYYNNKSQLSRETALGLNGIVVTKTYNYNSDGTLASVIDNAGRTVTYTHEINCSGRLTRTSSTDFNSDVQYSYNGKTITETDLKDGTTSTKTYDGIGNLITSDGTNGKVDYDYYPSGKLKSTTTGGLVSSMTYDPITLNLLTQTDPDRGTSSFTYNSFGQMVTKTDAKNQVVNYNYDAVGRIQSITGSAMNIAYTYSTTPGSLGLLQNKTRDGISETYTYDNLGRQLTSTTSGAVTPGAGSTNFTTSFSYDPTTSRLSTIKYPSGLSIKYGYDIVGNITKIDNIAGGNIWTGNTANAGNQWTQFTLGNNLVTKLEYGTDGMMTTIKTGTTSAPTSIQNLAYSYNASKQLTRRTDGVYGLSEDFTYDAQNRLTSDGLTGQAQYLHQYTYAANGNITNSSVAGNYNYNAPQPHAVSSVNGIVTATGSNSAPSLLCTSTYNPENKTLTIDNGTYKDEFTYGTNGNRFRLDLKTSGVLQRTKVYVGSNEFGYNATGTSVYKRTIISAPTGVCALWQDSAGVQQLFYIHTDNQGSWLAISNQSATITNRYSYDAWGRPRDVNTWYLKPVSIASPVTNLAALQPRFDYGYTGQEHMSAFGLINMNGRIYDPYLQRFISPDPYVQDPTDAQNYNRYSYCLNNPLSFTDPSGYKWSTFKRIKNAVLTAPSASIVLAANATKKVFGENKVTNSICNQSEEFYMGGSDASYYLNRLCGQSRTDASNNSIFGGFYNDCLIRYTDFELWGNKRRKYLSSINNDDKYIDEERDRQRKEKLRQYDYDLLYNLGLTPHAANETVTTYDVQCFIEQNFPCELATVYSNGYTLSYDLGYNGDYGNLGYRYTHPKDFTMRLCRRVTFDTEAIEYNVIGHEFHHAELEMNGTVAKYIKEFGEELATYYIELETYEWQEENMCDYIEAKYGTKASSSMIEDWRNREALYKNDIHEYLVEHHLNGY